MAFRVSCPSCRALCDVAEEHVGKRILCPACQKPFQLAPATKPASAPARPAAAPKSIQPAAKVRRPAPAEKKGAVLQTANIGYYRNRRRRRRGRGWLIAGSALTLLLIGAGVAFLILRPKPERAALPTMVARNATAVKPVSALATGPGTPADSKKSAPTGTTRAPATAPTSRSAEPEASKKPASAPEKSAAVTKAEDRTPGKKTPKQAGAAPETKTPDAQAKSASPDQAGPPLKSLLAARQVGWQAVLTILPVLESADAKQFPGSVAFAKQLRELEKTIDVKLSPERWPDFDVDALVSRNGKFWQTYFEIVPGDPGTYLLHAALLLTAGEATRASYVLTLARQRPGIPDMSLKALDLLQMQALAVFQEGNATVQAGIQRFDQGDRKAAMELYKKALAQWPQNSLAHYELGYTLFVEELVAAGRPPPKQGTVTVIINGPRDLPRETARRYTLTRRHNPLEQMAYQGSDKEVINRLLPMVNKVMPAWKKIAEASKEVDDAVLKEFSEASQEVALDELALVARQILAARHTRYRPEDLPFFRTSLVRLAPGPEVESTLKLLAGDKIVVRSLTTTDWVFRPEQGTPARAPSKIADIKQLRLYVPGPEMPNRIGKDIQPFANYVKALEKATGDYLQKAPKPEAKGLLIAVGIKAGKKSKVWCQAVDGKAPADILRGLEKELEKIEPIALEKAPIAFGLEIQLWGQEVSAFPEFPDVWQEGAKKTKNKLLVPPDELFQILWPDA